MNLNNLISNITEVRNSVIGIFKMGYTLSLIVKENKDTVNLIHISNLGEVRQEYGIPTEIGKVCIFPDEKNMNEMLQDPFKWTEWYNKNVI